MDTSVNIIGLIILILIGIPLSFAFRSNVINKKKIKAIKKQYSQNERLNFELTEAQNKKVLALDKKNKGFLFMDFNSEKDSVYFVNLNDTNSCKIVLTTENNSDTIVKMNQSIKFVYMKIINWQKNGLKLFRNAFPVNINYYSPKEAQ
jgi:hypothetical protein